MYAWWLGDVQASIAKFNWPSYFFIVSQSLVNCLYEITDLQQCWNSTPCLSKDKMHIVGDSWGWLSGDDLFSAPKTSWSPSNSDLGYLWHSLDSDRLWVPETLRSTSYSEPLPAVPNATVCSFHSDPSPDIPSNGCSETSTSSEGNPETSSDSTPSDPKSGPMFFGNSPSHSGDRVAPAAFNIKGWVVKVIHDVKGQWWSGLMGNARQWPWS